jgi:hypothetical protein
LINSWNNSGSNSNYSVQLMDEEVETLDDYDNENERNDVHEDNEVADVGNDVLKYNEVVAIRTIPSPNYMGEAK